MKPNLPNWMFLGGVGALALSNTSKELSPDVLGRITALQWGCAVVSAFLFSTGLFLALRGLFSQQDKRKQYVLPCLFNLIFLIGLPSLYFFAYIVSTQIYHSDDEFPGILLPKLVEGAQSANTEEKILKVAQATYGYYGLKLPYRLENGDFKRYEPSGQEVASFVKSKQLQLEAQAVKKRLKSAMDQWPYLFAFYMGAFFITFSVGSLWVAFRKAQSGTQPPVLT